jgi:hypothetical protein
MEVLRRPCHIELSNAFHKVGTMYHGSNNLLTALGFYQKAALRESCDQLLEGIIAKESAMLYEYCTDAYARMSPHLL